QLGWPLVGHTRASSREFPSRLAFVFARLPGRTVTDLTHRRHTSGNDIHETRRQLLPCLAAHSSLVGIFLKHDVAARLFYATDGVCLWRRYVLDLAHFRY